MQKRVSVVMPVYNEERFIGKCIESLLQQTYPQEDMEWFFVDGGSTDRTREIINEYIELKPDLIRLLDNPNKTVPYAMNIGITASQGEYIVRLDAHAEYREDYIEKCVYYLDHTDADNVGGLAETIGRGTVGGAIARMLSSKFGVGNSQFRTGGKSGYVDTVPFGAFCREVFQRIGLYNEKLTRNQDNEMNYRIRKNGGKIFLSDDIRLSYYCRDTIKGIADMAVKNGRWNIITMKLCPGTMGIRHFIPLVFLLSLIVMTVLSLLWWVMAVLFAVELGLYLLLDIIFSAKGATGLKEFGLLLILFPIFHLSYGWGSLMGILGLHKWK